MKKITFSICLILLFLQSKSQETKFEWAHGIGSDGQDYGLSVTDLFGNTYITGSFEGKVDFDPGPKTFYLITPKYSNLSKDYSDIFISKFNSSGNFVWALRIGGNSEDLGQSITLDSIGNVYITGVFIDNVDFDPGSGIFNLTAPIYNAIFILKLDTAGNFKWAKKIGGTLDVFSIKIALDKLGNVYTTGGFEGTADFDPGEKTYNLTSSGWEDIFISKIDALGNFVWAKKIGGTLGDYGQGIAIDVLGNVYVTGSFRNTVDFDPGSGIFNYTSPDKLNLYFDIFILKLDASGNFKWAKQIGGSSYDFVASPVIDLYGNVHLTGGFHKKVDFDPGSAVYNLDASDGMDVFILKLDSSGNFIWAKQMGANTTQNDDNANSIALDFFGNIYIGGFFKGIANFETNSGTFSLTSTNYNETFNTGQSDIFILKLDTLGNFIWAKQMGGISFDVAYSIDLDLYGNIYTTGAFKGTADFDQESDTFYLTSAQSGDFDIFIHKMSQPYFVHPNEIKEYPNLKDISIHPNPTTGILNIESQNLNASNLKIQILNTIGQIVMEETGIEHLAHGETGSQLNIQHFPEGLYLIRVIDDKQIIATQKIIKQ